MLCFYRDRKCIPGYKDLKRSYGEACEALNYKVLYGKNNVISFANTNINENNWSTKTDEISKIGFS